MPTIPIYSGMTDPRQNTMKYEWHMDSARATYAVKCKCFPISLEGMATTWLTRLPPRSISLFDQLARKFIEQFRMHTARSKDVMSLSNLFQGPGDSLKDFLQRFNTAVTVVSNPRKNIILMALIGGIHPDTNFREWLSRKPPSTLDRFYNKAAQYLRKEEALQTRQVDRTGHPAKRIQNNIAVKQSGARYRNIVVNVKNKNGNWSKGRNRTPDKNPDSRRRLRVPRFVTYTPLNDSIENIYLATCNLEQYRKPASRESAESQRKSKKFWRVHETHGHDINECIHR